jgi:hypothetical protein
VQPCCVPGGNEQLPSGVHADAGQGDQFRSGCGAERSELGGSAQGTGRGRPETAADPR